MDNATDPSWQDYQAETDVLPGVSTKGGQTLTQQDALPSHHAKGSKGGAAAAHISITSKVR